ARVHRRGHRGHHRRDRRSGAPRGARPARRISDAGRTSNATARRSPPSPPPMIIETESLAKRYGRTDALVDLTMRVEPGEVFGFLGPNGAGKTTAVKLFLGLARP